MQLSFSSQSTICWRLVASPSRLYASRRRRCTSTRLVLRSPVNDLCRSGFRMSSSADRPSAWRSTELHEDVKVRIFLPPCRALLLPRLGMWLACRAYMLVYIYSFTSLYVYTCIRPIIFSHLPRFAILGTLKQPRPYSPAAPIGDALIATPSSSLDPCP